MRSLPISGKGYPVPFFVAWIDGEPEFRVADQRKFVLAVKKHLCWICGQVLGSHTHFLVGPMCTANRLSSEPPMHLACAEYALLSCPFMMRPRAQRREANMPENKVAPGGLMVTRNPGVIVEWESRDWRIVKDPAGAPLIDIGNPVAPPRWFTEGRLATRLEAVEAYEESCETILDMARAEGEPAVRYAEQRIMEARKFLPSEVTA
jgi:hypothetical protein